MNEDDCFVNKDKKDKVIGIIENACNILGRPVPEDIFRAQVDTIRIRKINTEEINEILSYLVLNKKIKLEPHYQYPNKRQIRLLW